MAFQFGRSSQVGESCLVRASSNLSSSKISVANVPCILEIPDSPSHVSLDHTEFSDTEKTTASEIFAASFTSSSGSMLSARYDQRWNNPNETTWIKNKFSSWLADSTDRSEPSMIFNEPQYEEGFAHEWLDSGNSSVVSLTSNEQVLDALATKLAPARPQIVNLSHETPVPVNSSSHNLQNRPSTPYRLPHRQPKRRGDSPLLSLETEVGISSSPITDKLKNNCSLIDEIYETVKAFPKHLLFLDTPCVVEIRHQNHAAPQASIAENKCIATPDSPISTSRVTKFLAPMLRSSRTKSFPYQDKLDSPPATPLPSNRPTSSMISNMTNFPMPDLSVLERIFPSAQEWWRSILYAHLVTYNYICANHVPSRANTSRVSAKASRTLGITERDCGPSLMNPPCDGRLEMIELELVSCITWITNCMSESLDARMDRASYGRVPEKNYIVVRALAEIVKTCEQGFREQPENSS